MKNPESNSHDIPDVGQVEIPEIRQKKETPIPVIDGTLRHIEEISKLPPSPAEPPPYKNEDGETIN